MRPRMWVAVAALLVLVAMSPPSARAGTYPVVACLADVGKFRTHAFTDFATRGMRITRACGNRVRHPRRGLFAGNIVRKGTVASASRATLTLYAPVGMVFEKLEWTGDIRRTDCRYDIRIRARGPGVDTALTQAQAGKKCPRRSKTQRSAKRGDIGRDIKGANRIVVSVLCKAGRGKRCSARRANYAKLGVVSAQVADATNPTVAITGGDLVSGRWVRGNQTVTYTANDQSGIAQASVLVSGGVLAGKNNPCDHSRPTPCPRGPDSREVATSRVRDGTHDGRVLATDAAGNQGASSPAIVRIDNTAPLSVPLSASGGQDWRSSNAFGVTWSNPPEGDAAPIDSALYRICRLGGRCEDPKVASGTAEAAGVQVAAPGEWTLTVWRRDQAGNADEQNASPPVTLRYDPEAPSVSLGPINASDPTLLTAPVSDPLSGVASGQLEISRVGTQTWQSLATSLVGDRLEARVDDAAFPPGRYRLRASATDQAGNSRTSDRRSDGSVAEVDLPLRLEASLSAGVVGKRTVRRVVRRKGKRRVVRRRVSVLRQRARARLGRAVAITGRLLTKDGRALPGSLIHVFSRGPDGVERYAGSATTDAAGRYRYVVRASANRQLRLFYLGASTVRPAIRSVELVVPARTTFRTSGRRLLNGQAVRFSGRLAVPPSSGSVGKLVELQTKLSGRWQTFRTLRTDARGRWRSAYRFRRTRGLIRYRFRARLPREASYPFAGSATRSVRVTVRGR